MDFIFELIAEIIMEPIMSCYAFAMTRFAKNNKKIDDQNVKIFCCFEFIVFFLAFVISGIALLENKGSYLCAKIIFFISIAMPVIQIFIGYILGHKRRG